MAAVDQFDQPAAVDMGVDLRRADIGMAQHGLQRAQVCAALQQMRGEGMAQHMGADPLRRDAGSGGQGLHHLIKTNPADMALARREKPGTVGRHMGQPGRHGGTSPVGDRHQPLARALAFQDQERAVRRQGAARQRHQFRGPKPRSVKQFDERRQPQIQRRWFAWPNLLLLSPVPVITLALFVWLLRALKSGREATPFLLALGLFGMCYLGLGISILPMIVPYSVTLWAAASSPKSQAFLMIGTLFLLPIIVAYTGWSYWVFRGKVRAGEGYH